MIYIRCTQKLLKRMKGPDDLPASVTKPASDGRLGEWYANVKSLPFRGKSVVIFFTRMFHQEIYSLSKAKVKWRRRRT